MICGQRAVLYNKLWISFEMIQAGLNEFSIICKEYVTPQHKKNKDVNFYFDENIQEIKF